MEIQYIYHQHIGGDGSTIHSLSNPGGCYKASGHTCGYGGCNPCTGTLNRVTLDERGPEEYRATYRCSICGYLAYRWATSESELHKNIGSCGLCRNGTINTWVLGCGKTSESIEQAVITYK